MVGSAIEQEEPAGTAVRDKKPPTVVSVISDIETPVSAFRKLSADQECAFLFESTEGDSRLARYSFIGVEPSVTISFKEGLASIKRAASDSVETREFTEPLAVLQSILRENDDQFDETGLPFPFTGGLVGYMGYAATNYFEKIPQQSEDPFGVPEGFYGLYDSIVVFDHQYRRISVISRRGEEYARELIDRMIKGDSLKPLYADPHSIDESKVYSDVQLKISKPKFLSMVDQCREYIKEGQVFQIVVAQRFSLPIKTSSLDFYRVLQSINPSPYAYLLKMPGFSYVGSSPETFVRCTDGAVMLRAIAGTRPRGTTPAQDIELEEELKASEKEMAEHRMLVDLGRNDLGRVCKVGTVKVGEIAMLTKYTHVMHLATEINGTLSASKTCFDAFRGCFPRGTVSGAPKVRAMQLLSQLEPEQRGIYSGVVGYFDFKGNMDGAIAIRSALVKDGQAHVNAGAGIVLDSDPEGEYEETRNKARSVIKAIKIANELEDR